jgi:hypothetical protein
MHDQLRRESRRRTSDLVSALGATKHIADRHGGTAAVFQVRDTHLVQLARA